MQMPKPIIIELTDEQVAKLKEHYDYVLSEWGNGEPGILVAQVGASQYGGHQYMRVGFLKHEHAKTVAGTAA
jgi:hypothetical protein